MFAGQRSVIFIGPSIRHGIWIAADGVVGSSSFVRSDVEDNSVVYGVPAQFVRDRQVGDPYL